jgi:hypothetical protein
VFMLNDSILSAIMVNVVKVSVIRLSAIMLSVMVPKIWLTFSAARWQHGYRT